MQIKQQLKTHSVALVSLLIALSSLAYNTWRNEQSEDNRNIRTAGIALLLKLGDLERVVFFSQYGENETRGDAREGWSYALTIADLGALTKEPAVSSSRILLETWEANFEGLGSDEQSWRAIDDGINLLRADLQTVLSQLD